MLWSLVTVAVGDATQSPETQSIGTEQRPDVARSIVHLTHHCHTDHSTHPSTTTTAADDDATDAAADNEHCC